MAKKYELMALNKKALEFFHFLAHLPQKVGDPCSIGSVASLSMKVAAI